MNESILKDMFKRSVRHDGGFAESISSNIRSGLPDLLVIPQGRPPIVVEAKFIKIANIHKFSRKIDYSAMQINFMNGANKACECSALGLVGFVYEKQIYACLIHPSYAKIDSKFRSYTSYSFVTAQNQFFDVSSMFAKLNDMKIASQTIPEVRYAI